MVEDEVNKYKLSSESSILDFLKESIVEPSHVGTRLVFNGVFSAIGVSRLVTEHHVNLDKVKVKSRSIVVEHHESS